MKLIIFFITFSLILNIKSAYSSTTYVDAYDFSNQNSTGTYINGLEFNDDGTKVFIIDGNSDLVTEYSLSTAYDLLTMSFTRSYDVSGEESNPKDLVFNNDGKKLFIIGQSGDGVDEYHLTTGYDLSTMSHDSFKSTSSQEQAATGITFNSNGTKMFIVGYRGDEVNEFTLTTGFDVSTASHDSLLSVSSQESTSQSIRFNNDGTKMFVMGSAGDDVNEYTLSVGFDISSTVNFVDAFSVKLNACGNPASVDSQGLAFNNDGTKMYVTDTTNDIICTFSLSTGFDVSTASFSSRVITNGLAPSSSHGTFSYDGSKYFIVDSRTESIVELSLSTSFDVSTASFVDRISVIDQESSLNGLTFNKDGTKMYIIGFSGDDVNEYHLSTGYDLSTASHDSVFSVSSQTTNPIHVRFNYEGTKMYISDFNHKVFQYSLSTAYDVSTASYDNVNKDFNSLAGMVGQINQINFSPDGTRLYVPVQDFGFGSNTGVHEYSVSTAFDLSSTVTAIGKFDTSSQGAPYSFEFNSDGTKVFIFDINREIHEYTVSCALKVTSSSTCYTGAFYTSSSESDPTTNKDVVGSIDAQISIVKNIFTQSVGVVSNRLSYLRQNRDNDNLSKNNIKLDFGNAILTSLTNELLAKNDKSIIPDNWSSWSEGSISVTKIGDSTNSSSSETDGQALAFGFDTKLNDNDLLGFAIQYGKSDTDVGSNGTNVDSENINLSVYRTRPLNDDNFIEGMFGVGLIESDLKRVSGANTLTGSRNGTQIFGSINYGKTLDKGDFNLTPIARVDLGYTELDAYSETGTDALTYAKQSIESGLASVGLQFSDIIKLNKNSFKPFGSIEYGMDFSNSSDAKMNYVSDTSTIYTYTQGANSNHLITSVVGFEYITKDNLNIISSYKRIQGNESEQTDILNVSVNFKSKQETEYAMTIDGSEDLKAGFDISKNINGFDLKFNANQSLSENSDQAANVSLSRSY